MLSDRRTPIEGHPGAGTAIEAAGVEHGGECPLAAVSVEHPLAGICRRALSKRVRVTTTRIGILTYG
ncbi:MAG: hypothetical protein ACXVUL_12670 [Solirubrobacteraceae bacterium]